MGFELRGMSILVLFLLLLSTVFAACDVEVSNLITEVRDGTSSSSSDFDSDIVLEKNNSVDVRLSFDIEDYYSTSCSQLKARLKISRYDESVSDWVEFKTTEKTISVQDDYEEVLFDNIFNTGSNSDYSSFLVEGMILEGSRILDSSDASIEIEDESCDGIELVTATFYIDESDFDSKTFVINNETTADFEISNIELISSSSVILDGDVDYPSVIYAKDSGEIEVSLETRSVSNNTNTTILININGYLNNKYCSSSAIGKKSISVVVRNNSNSNNSGSGVSSNSDCSNIQIQSQGFEFLEGTNQQLILGIKNNSTKRFEILEIQASSSDFELNENDNEQYVFSGQTINLSLNASLPNVSFDSTLTGNLKVRGVFSDGKSCSFTQIDSETINVKVINSNELLLSSNCNGFEITAPESIIVQNNGSFDFTINNFSNKTVQIIVEGETKDNATVIILPKNSSLSRKMNVELFSSNGFVKFIPKIDGCNLNSKTVNITNTSTGNFEELKMDLEVQRDYNLGVITLNTKINNPSNKVFEGTLKISSPNGWPDVEKNVLIAPGENNLVEKLGSSGRFSEGEIQVSFSSEGKTISNKINTNESKLVLAGLFAFGGNLSSLGIILMIILVIIIIVGVIGDLNESAPVPKEKWVNEKN